MTGFMYFLCNTDRMSREGLVQRKTAAQASGGASAKDDDEEGQGHRPLDDDKDNDDDGKTTRLTLMEEVLLLGLKDREVAIIILYIHHLLLGNMHVIKMAVCLSICLSVT